MAKYRTRGSRLTPRLFLLVTILIFADFVSCSPITNPLKADGDITKIVPSYFDTKYRPGVKNYHNATPLVLEDVPLVRYDHNDPSCNVGLRLKWSTNVGSSVFAPPVLYPSGSDGKKQIFISTFYQYIEILGYDGFKPWGWPLSFEDSSFQGSPMIYDVDNDGSNDIGIVDKDANLHWIRVGEFGQYLDDYHAQVPKLKVKKDWASGLNPSFVDSYAVLSMFDHKNYNEHVAEFHEGNGDKEENIKGRRKAKKDDLSIVTGRQDSYPGIGGSGTNGIAPGRMGIKLKKKLAASNADTNAPGSERRRLTEVPDPHANQPRIDEHQRYDEEQRQLQMLQQRQHDEEAERQKRRDDELKNVLKDQERQLRDVESNEVENQRKQEDASLEDLDRDKDDYISHRIYGEGYRSFDDGYRYYMGGGGMYNESNFVYIDPHVLGSPVLVDVNGDGHMEVIIAVSYYFDAEKYKGKDIDFDPSQYIAGGIACWDLQANEWSWMVHLDLTTDQTKFKALIHGTPTVADLDGNGRYEVLIGTSLGLLYLLDGETGFVRRYFPMQFNQIEAQIAVADVRGGSDLEIIVADMAGNLVLVDIEGEILWDTKLSGSLPHSPTVGDVNGDGHLDIVVVATSETGSHLWAVNGATGVVLDGYPIALPKGGSASSPVILVDLHDYTGILKKSPTFFADPALPVWLQRTNGHEPAPSPSLDINLDKLNKGDKSKSNTEKFNHKHNKGLHLLVPSFDGHIYVIDGSKGCAERIDIGEHIYSVPLVDDVTGNGFLDVIVGTMNGQVMLLETSVPAHTLNTWTSFPKHRLNGFTHGQIGISIPEVEKRALRYADIKGGQNLTVTFDIWDSRPPQRKDDNSMGHSYVVSFTSGTNKLSPLLSVEFHAPGRYTVQVPVSPPVSMTLVVSMTNEHGLYFEDTVPVSVSTRFYVWIKYLVAFPAILVCAPLLLMNTKK